jgi:hypothetical protein
MRVMLPSRNILVFFSGILALHLAAAQNPYPDAKGDPTHGWQTIPKPVAGTVITDWKISGANFVR